MANNYFFYNNCNIEKVKKLCLIAIKLQRGKIISKKILQELESKALTKETYKTLSHWIHPKRDELVQPLFECISVELFGSPPDRID